MSFKDGGRGAISKRPVRIAVGLTILLLVGLGVWSYLQRGARTAPVASVGASPQYAGAQTCAGCHAQQAERWRASHHAQAMQVASEKTVLADFNDAHFNYAGVTSRFFKRDGKFFAHTDGPDGKLQDHEVRYTFGVYPLQQYLVSFPNGRLQPLSIAWDSRPKSEGGQRWFHLYPGEAIKAGDPLHWTGRNQNWNSMCAACHTTNLRKNYDLASDKFATTWSELNVACEACHGPGSNHVKWAGQPSAAAKAGDSAKGLITDLGAAKGGHWTFAEGQAVAHWSGDKPPQDKAQFCFGCHARRGQLVEPTEPGRPFLDNYAPTLLEPGIYHADGQILDEVFEYGSFIQSKMYRAGVTCSNCHEPHSLQLRATGNGVCTQCHRPSVFDQPEHHRHPAGSEAAQCVSCHMSQRTYMGVDVRRDHSFRVPRPDLSAAHGVPNACTQCHSNKPSRWAAEAVKRWYGAGRRSEPHFVGAIDAAWRRLATTRELLESLAQNPQRPGIARATALTLLPSYASSGSLESVRQGVQASDALVRASAVRTLESVPAAERVRIAAPLLDDSVRVVRVAVGHVLAGVPDHFLSTGQLAKRAQVIDELINAERTNDERPESHMNLAALYVQMGRAEAAEEELRTALRLDPQFVPAMLNLADLYRGLQREAEGERLLERAVGAAPDAPAPRHALGLLRVRQGNRQQALELLADAARLAPQDPRYSYVYGVALHSMGDVHKSIAVLEAAHKNAPADRDILLALIKFQWDRGDKDAARKYASKLVQLSPGDPAAESLRRQVAH